MQVSRCFPLGLTISPTTATTTDMYSKADVILSGVATYVGLTSFAFVYLRVLVRSAKSRQVHDASHKCA